MQVNSSITLKTRIFRNERNCNDIGLVGHKPPPPFRMWLFFLRPHICVAGWCFYSLDRMYFFLFWSTLTARPCPPSRNRMLYQLHSSLEIRGLTTLWNISQILHFQMHRVKTNQWPIFVFDSSASWIGPSASQRCLNLHRGLNIRKKFCISKPDLGGWV